MFDESNIEDLDYSYEVLSNYDKDELIDIIKLLHKKNDQLNNISRTEEGEEIIGADELIDDKEEIIR